MTRKSLRSTLALLRWLSLALALVAWAGGCGGDDEPSRASGDKCSDVRCEDGQVCDGSTGRCVDVGGEENPCSDVRCEDGQVCDGSTGRCVDVGGEEDPCAGVSCGQGQVCDGATGRCVDVALDLCAGVTCDRGVCDPGTGDCADPDTCEEDRDCLEGHFCHVVGGRGECLSDRCAGVACDDGGSCDRLTGDCVEPSPCSTDDDCLGERVCESGRCAPPCTQRDAPCPDGTVCDPERGICWQDLGEPCDGDEDCIGEHVCDQVCVPSCHEVPCMSGVCRDDGHCTPVRDGEQCRGSHECPGDGQVCVDGGCVDEDPREACDCPRGQMCTDFGCASPARCQVDGDCLEGQLCHPVTGTCVQCLYDDQCPGAQVCLDGLCSDAVTCRADLDCVGAGVCDPDEHRCVPGRCDEDRFEPNGSMEAAPRVGDGLFTGLTLCPGDEDWFAVVVPEGWGMSAGIHFDAAEGDLELELFDPDVSLGDPVLVSSGAGDMERVTLAHSQGPRVVYLHVYGRGNGVGYALSIRLREGLVCLPDELDGAGLGDDPDLTPTMGRGIVEGEFTLCDGDDDWFAFEVPAGGTLVADVVFDEHLGDLDVALVDMDQERLALSATDRGVEHVSWTNDSEAMATVLLHVYAGAGVSNAYRLMASVVAEGGAQECDAAVELEEGRVYEGDTSGSADEQQLSCGGDGSPDDVFVIHVQERGVLSLALEADGWDAALGVRASCANAATELACVTEPTRLSALVDPGDYFLVVDGRGAGPYRLGYTFRPALCDPGERACLGDLVGECRPDGAGWAVMARCDHGCDPDAALCASPNDLCETAAGLEPGQPVHGSIVGVGDDYLPTCSMGARSGDVVYSFTVPEGGPVAAVVDLVGSEGLDVSMRTSCSSPGSEVACAPAGQRAIVEVVWPGTYYLIVDSDGREGEFDLSVELVPLTCVPGERRCEGDLLQTCMLDPDQDGLTSFSTTTRCERGCDHGFCEVPNDRCDGAAPLMGRVSGSTAGAHDDGRPTCAPGTATGDLVYTFTLEERAGVDIVATTDLDRFQPVLHLRKDDCGVQSAEVACETTRFEGTEPVAPPEIHAALEAGTYYLFVDGLNGTEGQFGLRFDTFEIACDPDAPSECDGDYMMACSPDGKEVVERLCPWGCVTMEDGQGRCVIPNDSCVSAMAIDPAGGVVHGTTAGARADTEGLGCRSPARGGDVFYAFTLDRRSAVDIRLRSDWDNQLIVRRGDCTGREMACEDGPLADGGQALSRYVGVLEPGRYWIVVKAVGSAGGDFTLEMRSFEPVCSAGVVRCDPWHPLQPQVCLRGAEWVDLGEPCAFACRDGRCVESPGETCLAAQELTPGEAVRGDTTPMAHDYEPGRSLSPDLFYVFTLDHEQVVRVTLHTLDSRWDTALYLLGGGCGELTEIAYVEDRREDGLSEIELPLGPGTYHLVVTGATRLAHGRFTLSLEAMDVVCLPGATRCSREADGVEVCAHFGAAWELDHPCTAGCEAGRCVHANDRCGEGAIPLELGVPVTGDTTDALDDYVGTCVTGATPDLTYSFELDHRTGVEITLRPLFTGQFFVRGDCEDSATEVACVLPPERAGLDTTWSGVLDSGTWYVVVDGVGFGRPDDGGPFTLTVETYEPVCDPWEQPAWCQGATLVTCRHDGRGFETLECPGACEVDHCVVPNDTCDGALTMAPDRWYSGDLAVATPDYLASCGGQGKDVVFAFTVPRGATGVRLDLEALSGSPMMHLRRGACDEPEGHRAEIFCGGSFLGHLDPGDYYLVVDSAPGGEGEFGVRLSFFDMVCEPGVSECVDGAWRRCSVDGTELLETRCPELCDPGVGCVTRGDTCSQALPIELVDGVASVHGDTTGAAHAYLDARDEGAPDLWYRLDLYQRSTVTVTMSTDSEDFDPYLYLLGGTCDDLHIIDRDDDSGEGRGSVITQVLPRGTYFIVATGFGVEDEGPFDLTVQVREPMVCLAGATFCDGDALRECAQDGLSSEVLVERCAFGCRGGAGNAACEVGCEPGARFCTDAGEVALCSDDGTSLDILETCAEPTICVEEGDGAQCANLCQEAVPITPGITEGDLAGAPANLTRTCSGWGDLGVFAERLYSFTLDASAVVELTATPGVKAAEDGSEGDWDIVMELRAAGCADGSMVVECRDIRLAGTQEVISAQLEAGTYYVLIEAYTFADYGDAASLPFTLELDVREIVCAPGAAWCDGDRPATCNDDGTEVLLAEACPTGCVHGHCVAVNQTCDAAIPMESGHTYEGDTEGATNDGAGGCALGNAGDLVYSFVVGEHTDGVVLGLEAQFAAYLHLRKDDCSSEAAEVGCFLGEQGPGGYSVEVTTRLEPGTYYLFVDGFVADGAARRGAFTLYYEAYDMVCDPETTWCGDEGLLHECSQDGTEETTWTCPGDCSPDCVPYGRCPTDDPFEQEEEAGVPPVLQDQGTHVGALCSTDQGMDDWYAVELALGTTVHVDLTWDPDTEDLDLFLFHDMGAGHSVASSATWSVPESFDYLVTEAGTYYIQVVGFGDEVTYRLDVSFDYPECGNGDCELGEDDESCPDDCVALTGGDTCEEATEIEVDYAQVVTMVGSTEGAQDDSEGFRSSPDVYYVFTLDRPSYVSALMTTAPAAWDTYLYLLHQADGADGPCGTEEVAHNDDYTNYGAGDSGVDDVLLDAGTYFLLLTGYGAAHSGAYQLDVTFREFVPECGNGDCELGEDAASCPADCGGDQCETAFELPTDDGEHVIHGSTSGRAHDYAPHRSASPDLFYTFTLDTEADVSLLLTRDEGDFDTYLYLLSGACDSLQAVALSDDYRGEGYMAGEASRIPEVEGGTSKLEPGTYYVVVTGYHAASEGAFTLTATFQGVAAGPPNLFFSEYVEGSSTNKALEVYNGGGSPYDLGQCEVQIFANGRTYEEGPGTTVPVADEGQLLQPGDVWVLCHGGFVLTQGPEEDPIDPCDARGNLNYNGNDALLLVCEGTVLDSVGKVGESTYWTNGGVSTKDKTLTRKPSVCGGDEDFEDDFDPSEQWDAHGKDFIDTLGTHNADCD